MATSRHSAGPWFVDDRFPDTVRAASGTVIAVFDNANKGANARLGAAAPDMLAVLKAFIGDDGRTTTAMLQDAARAAVAKAEG